MECRRGKRLQRTVSTGSGSDLGLLDMNASPAREIEGDDAGFWLNPELALTNSAPKMQDTCRDPFLGFTLTSSNTRANMRYVPNGFPSTSTSHSTMNLDIARMNLDIATQNANLVYLQALNDYISEQRGILGDGWCVKFEYSETTCKTSPIYCAPDGSRYDSMAEVAHHLGLLSTCNSFQTIDSGSLLQNGSHATKSVEGGASRSLRADVYGEHKSVVSNGGNAVEVDPMENGNHESEPFLDGFPLQFEDFFVMSVGKIDPQRPFHNICQIWPIGYKSIWHDKLTGSIFICNVLNGDNYGPVFRVNRYPCSKQSLPNASTVIHRPKSGPSDETASCLTTESTLPSDNFINGDIIGEFSVEGRSPSSAWQMVLETLLCACRQAFQDLSVVNFCCSHSVDVMQGQYGHDSLDKFGYLSGLVNSIPNLIQTPEQLEIASIVLRRWLKPDRFGLDAEFVQEFIEQLPGVAACSEYKSLDARCQDSIGFTVRSGFFTVSHKYISLDARLNPPGHSIASNLPPGLIGDVLQAYEFSLRFHKLLGQDASFSRQNLENELLDPCESYVIEDITSCSTIAPASGSKSSMKCTGVILSNFQMAMLKVLVEDMLEKVVICDPFMEFKSRKGRKKNMEINFSNKKTEPGILPINEITWPEVARRYILVLLSMDDNYEAPDMTNREFDQVFRCLNGDGGPLCGSLTGMPAIEADATILAEASKTIFSPHKNGDLMIDKDLDSVITTKRPDNKCPEWIKVLEPVRSQPTNVGARIRNRVFKSLEKQPPEWAKEMLLRSISKDVYKGNAAGPTKKIVVSVLDKVRDENPLTKKKAKESRVVKTVSDAIIKRCRMVLRYVAAEDENKAFFALMKPNESDDVAVSRGLDFRIIDLRLDAGFYDDSLESFIEDVHEVWQNLRITYKNKPKYLDLIYQISTKLEELYKQEVLPLVSKTVDYWKNPSSSSREETKKDLNTMIMDTTTSTLFIAPWEDGICKVCGKDENDHILLLCDRCDAEYHTYCLDPPLQRVPKASWYCPNCISFITSQGMSRGEDWVGPILKKKYQREFSRIGSEVLADLADVMESVEYWELGVKERIFLLNFLCDESLSSALIQTHMSEDGYSFQTNFLGRDSDGRLYWVLDRPERVFSSFPLPSESSWICYESDDEVKALIDWLKDDDAREKELKQNINHWLRNKSNDEIGQQEMKVDRFKLTVLRTNARAELEKKFGLFLERGIYRCGCLELVGPTLNHHCFSCHSTFFNNEVHRCLGPEGINGKKESSLRPVVGRASEILPCLKTILLDIEVALPMEAFRPSRRKSDRVRGWRAFLKSAQSIYEMVEATIVLEDMIKTEYLRKEWRYWSSPSSAAKISTISALALQIYALDAALFYEPPPPPVDLMEFVVAGDSESKEETPKKSNLKNYRKMIAMLNDSETKSKSMKKKLEVSD